MLVVVHLWPGLPIPIYFRTIFRIGVLNGDVCLNLFTSVPGYNASQSPWRIRLIYDGSSRSNVGRTRGGADDRHRPDTEGQAGRERITEAYSICR
jgi:hypothetical protein